MSESTALQLQGIKERSEAVQMFGPYEGVSKEVRQRDYHSSYGSGMLLCKNFHSPGAAQSVAAILNEHAQMLRALQAIDSVLSAIESDADEPRESQLSSTSLASVLRIHISEALNAEVSHHG